MSMQMPATPVQMVPQAPPMSTEDKARGHMDQMLDGKISPQEVNYRPATTGDRCANCANFLAPDACQVVAGKINPDGVSDAFAPIDQSGAMPPEMQAPQGMEPPPNGQ